MSILLHNKGFYKVTMGKEAKPQQPTGKSKYLINKDESFCFMSIHIWELLFHFMD